MRILLINLVIFLKNTDLACYYMMVTPFYEKPYEKNMKNLQTKIYLALFSEFEYLAPLQSNEIFFRVSSEKTYCRKRERNRNGQTYGHTRTDKHRQIQTNRQSDLRIYKNRRASVL